MNSEYKDNEKALMPSDSSDTNDIIENTDNAKVKKLRLPLVCKILYGLAAISAVLYLLFLFFPALADFFNKYISPAIRAPLAWLTGWIPFSLAEYLLLLLPVILIAVVSYGMKRYADSWRSIGIFCLIICSVGAYVFSTFTMGFVPSYRGSRLDVKMGLDKREVSAQELKTTAEILAAKLSEDIDEIVFTEDGSSVMPYSYAEMGDKLMDAYASACEKYDFIQPLRSNIKRIMLSEPMTYTHISGVYTFFTGEANLNVNYPNYTLPYTAAHEFAHQRGIAREDEANFVAFLVCIESDDAYIRYCAYLNLYEYVANALYSASPEYYAQVYYDLPLCVRREMKAYSEFFEKYRDSVASEVSGAVNDTFLTINGTEGTKSYGMVVDLAVAYYKKAD